MTKYKLILQRKKEFSAVKDNKGRVENSTTGELTLLNEHDQEILKLYTCENDGPSTDTPKQDKRIVAREYQLGWTKTSKNTNSRLGIFKNKAIWVKMDKNPAFANRMILIHVGNYPTDTEGCILVGTSTNNGYVSNSVDGIIKLFNELTDIGLNNVTLIVKEIA